MQILETNVDRILTRTGGYLSNVASHTLQPYCGCSYGNSLCGVGCYAQHLPFVRRGRAWGSFLEIRCNAANSYRKWYSRESAWARKSGEFSIFCSSATDPFVPQERIYRVTRSLLQAMLDLPPDRLILQTHSHLALEDLDLCQRLAKICSLRLHMSIETDRDRLPGLPPHSSSVEKRLAVCQSLKQAGIPVVVTVAPLLPIDHPEDFFQRIETVADAVIIDHYIEGDGSPNGSRTKRTPLPAAMQSVNPRSISLEYRNEMTAMACRIMPGRVGIGADGFAGHYLPRE